MNKFALPILVAMVVSLMAAPAVWAGGNQQAAKLSKQCQDALNKTPNKEAATLCQEGDNLRKQGKNDEAVAKLTQGLEKLGPVKGEMPKVRKGS